VREKNKAFYILDKKEKLTVLRLRIKKEIRYFTYTF
jgi:hypothetical protein